MIVGEICSRETVTVDADSSLMEAIQLMRQYHVGDVIVVENRGDYWYPVGILTDRDIVIEVLAKEVALDSVTVGDVMASQLLTVTDDEAIEDAVATMRSKGYRRVPVVNRDGVLEGILSLDDILELMAEQMANIAGLIHHEQEQEARLRH